MSLRSVFVFGRDSQLFDSLCLVCALVSELLVVSIYKNCFLVSGGQVSLSIYSIIAVLISVLIG